MNVKHLYSHSHWLPNERLVCCNKSGKTAQPFRSAAAHVMAGTSGTDHISSAVVSQHSALTLTILIELLFKPCGSVAKFLIVKYDISILAVGLTQSCSRRVRCPPVWSLHVLYGYSTLQFN